MGCVYMYCKVFCMCRTNNENVKMRGKVENLGGDNEGGGGNQETHPCFATLTLALNNSRERE